MRNLVFHRARIGGLALEALMSADGPAMVVRGHEGRRYEGWVALGVSRLRWFGSKEPGGMARPQDRGSAPRVEQAYIAHRSRLNPWPWERCRFWQRNALAFVRFLRASSPNFQRSTKPGRQSEV
jgi:hypothetical protein